MTLSLSDLFGCEQVMVILRGLDANATVDAANAAWDAGVQLVEVPIGQPHQVESLVAAVKAGQERRRLVGAGTVLTVDHAHSAAKAGAAYTVAPGLDVDVMRASEAAGIPHLPGVATATEVHRAIAAGAKWVKAFPAAALGPAWFSAMRGPFPHVHFMATGGIRLGDCQDYYQAGVRMIGFGAAAVDPKQREAFRRLVASRMGDGG